MKICAISDLHGYLPENIQPCDLVLIAGDITPLNIQVNMPESLNWIENDFKSWAENLPCDKVIFIAGNHDFWLERNHAKANNLFPRSEKVTYLLNEEYTYIGNDGNVITIFGSPYCHIFGNWAFMIKDDLAYKKFSQMSENTHIMLTHDAPYGCSDVCLENVWWNTGEHIGNHALAKVLQEKRPVYNIHGHLHTTSHVWEQYADTNVINVSLKNEQYDVSFAPLYFDM